MANRVINDKWYKECDANIDTKSIHTIEEAAQLIKANIRETEFEMDHYPTNSTIENNDKCKQWVPSLLQVFLYSMNSIIIIGIEVKQVAIVHSTVQASRPSSVISPVLFGIGVTVDHMVGCKCLLQILSRLGLSISSDEVTQYKQSISGTD